MYSMHFSHNSSLPFLFLIKIFVFPGPRVCLYLVFPVPQCIPVCVRTQWVKTQCIHSSVCVRIMLQELSVDTIQRPTDRKELLRGHWDACGICLPPCPIFIFVNTPRMFDQASILSTCWKIHPCQEPRDGYPPQPQAEVLPCACFALFGKNSLEELTKKEHACYRFGEFDITVHQPFF